MATVKIWKVTKRLDKVLDYVSNEEKTENKNYTGTELQELHDVLNYTVDPNKTEGKYFVSGINCQAEYALEQMTETKNQFKKTDGILAFHAFQSFAPGEVDPKIAHEIGKEFAQRMWGDRFEVVVATHIDRGHIHSHFVINSVSYVDGKKYYDNKKNYAKMRELSDDLCLEYGLSVIENELGKGKNYSEYTAEKNGDYAKNNIIKRDIDECIKLAMTEKDFLRRMNAKGYTFNFSHKYATISHLAFLKPRRLKPLGEEYIPESLARRIQESWRQSDINISEQDDLTEYFKPLPEPSYQRTYINFVTIVQIVKERPDSNRIMQKFLHDEIRKLDKLIEQQNLLCGNDIDTPEQLVEFKQSCKDEIAELEEARKKLRNQQKVTVRNGDEKEIFELKEDIGNLSARLKKLRKDIIVCERIEGQKPVIDERMDKCRERFEQNEMTRKKQQRTRTRTF